MGLFEAQGLPTTWDSQTNIRWRTRMSEFSNGSPLVKGKTLFVVSEPVELLALSLDDGAILWRKNNRIMDTLEGAELEAAKAERARFEQLRVDLEANKKKLYRMKRRLRRGEPEEGLSEAVQKLEDEVNKSRAELDANRRAQPLPRIEFIGYSSSTPVADDQGVYVVFGNGVLTHFDFKGNRRWSRLLGDPPVNMRGFNQGHAASPLLVGDKLIVGFNRLRVLDKRTGEIQWEGRRFLDFGTPAHMKLGGEDMIVTAFGEVYRLRDGALLASDLGDVRHNGPVGLGDQVFFVGADFARAMVGSKTQSTAQKPAKARALTLSYQGDRVKHKTSWITELETSDYYATPTVHEGIFYALSAKGVLSVLDAKKGTLLYREDLESRGNIYASPVIADGKLFLSGSHGEVWIYKTGAKAERIGENSLRDRVWSSPFIQKDSMYIRGESFVYRIGAQ